MKNLILSVALVSSVASVVSSINYANTATQACLQRGDTVEACHDTGLIYGQNQFAVSLIGLVTGGPVGMHFAPFVAHELADEPGYGLWFFVGLFAFAPSWFMSWQFICLANHIQRKLTHADQREYDAMQSA